MRFFLRSRKFKIICVVTSIIIILSIVLQMIGGALAPQSTIIGSVTAPFISLAEYISDSFTELNIKLNSGEELLQNNKELQDKVDSLSKQIVEYDQIKRENDYLKQYLEIKDNHKNFLFETATLISRDKNDSGYTFNINKGTVDGIAAYDPVITSSGLVGYVSEVGPSFSKVITVLNENIKVGCVDNRTSDVGILSGDANISKNGLSVMKNLSRNCSVALNDIVVTVGGGLFPSGLIVGTIENLSNSADKTSFDATVKISADILNLKEVMVITYFDGQESLE